MPDLPSADLTVIPVPGNAPEDVVVDADGNIWTGVDDGRIVRERCWRPARAAACSVAIPTAPC